MGSACNYIGAVTNISIAPGERVASQSSQFLTLFVERGKITPTYMESTSGMVV